MSISIVKNNMYKSYLSCGLLENNLNRLINILNIANINTANIVSQSIPIINYTISATVINFERMFQVNRTELHILFKEFNDKTNDMIFKLNALSRDLKRISVIVKKLYSLRKLSDGTVAIILNTKELRLFIPNVVRVKNELQIFKIMIDTNNKKLRVGMRK